RSGRGMMRGCVFSSNGTNVGNDRQRCKARLLRVEGLADESFDGDCAPEEAEKNPDREDEGIERTVDAHKVGKLRGEDTGGKAQYGVDDSRGNESAERALDGPFKNKRG